MAAAQVEHSEVGSNSYNGYGSEEYPKHASIGDKVNWLRGALASEPRLDLEGKALLGLWEEPREMIVRIATAYDRKSFYRAVYESSRRVMSPYLADIIMRWLIPEADFAACKLNHTLTNNELRQATSILCSRTLSEVRKIKDSYYSIFGVQLEVDIEKFTDGSHREVMLKYLRQASAPPGDVEMIDEEQLNETCNFLHKDIEEILKFPRTTLMNNIIGRPKEHLIAASEAYFTKFGTSLENDLSHAQLGLVGHGLRTIMKCSLNRPKYYAETLYDAMRDPSQIDREQIVMVLTIASAREMIKIKEEYMREYERTLEGDIYNAFSEHQDCLQFIPGLLNPNASN